MAASNRPLLSDLLGDPEIEAWLAPSAEIDAMLSFETALAEAEAAHGVIPSEAAKAIAAAAGSFSADMDAIREKAEIDGVVVPELVRQLRQKVGDPHAKHLHVGATSQDVIDTALILRLKPMFEIFSTRPLAITERFEELDRQFGHNSLMGRTRMQAAIPITVGDRLRSWSAPLKHMQAELDRLRRELLIVQFGGAAGTLEKLGEQAIPVRKALAQKLGLGDAEQWHSQRGRIADLANLLSQITGSLGKFGQDIALLAQDGGEIVLQGGGGSSAMAHKQNPVDAEILVALARFNAVQVSGIHQALIHEQERSGSAWTLEWLILPHMLIATGAATLRAARLAGNIASLGR